MYQSTSSCCHVRPRGWAQDLSLGASLTLNYLFKNKIYFIFSYVCMHVARAHVSVGACRVQKRVLDILELESTRTQELPCI